MLDDTIEEQGIDIQIHFGARSFVIKESMLLDRTRSTLSQVWRSLTYHKVDINTSLGFNRPGLNCATGVITAHIWLQTMTAIDDYLEADFHTLS